MTDAAPCAQCGKPVNGQPSLLCTTANHPGWSPALTLEDLDAIEAHDGRLGKAFPDRLAMDSALVLTRALRAAWRQRDALLDVASGKVRHVFLGDCPGNPIDHFGTMTERGPDARDRNCPACTAMGEP